MPCKFGRFCSVNNAICLTYPDTFPHLIIRVCCKTKIELSGVTFMNIGRISNEDCEGNENVHSYQNECIF